MIASDGESPVLEILEVKNTPSLPLLSDLLWPGVAVPIRVLSMS